MERKWLWKKKSSENSSGQTNSSDSVSSHSKRCPDEQEGSMHAVQEKLCERL